MLDRLLARGIAAVGAVAVGSGGAALAGAAAPAFAFTGTCPTTVPAATLVADGVCEVRFDALGSSTFTVPSGIAKLSAVLVGAGGGAFHDLAVDLYYAGNGGQVVYIDSVPIPAGSAVTVAVGAGGTSDVGSATPGGETSVGADVAVGGDAAGLSQQCGSFPELLNGNGARTSATNDTCLPGDGYLLSEIPGVDAALFPAAADPAEAYGAGGAATHDPDAPAASPILGTGGSVDDGGSSSGAGGLVVFRFAAPAGPVTPTPAPSPTPSATAAAPSLATTGADVSPALPAAAAAAIGVGAVLLAGSRIRARRRRRPGR